MTSDRRAKILSDVRACKCAREFSGYVAGLKDQGEMADSEVTLAVSDKHKTEEWPFKIWNPGGEG